MILLLLGIKTRNEEQLSEIASSSQGLVGISVAGISSGDEGTGAEVVNTNVNKSNTLNFVDIDTAPGNMKGQLCSLTSYALYTQTCF